MLVPKNGSRKGILTIQNRKHLQSNNTTQKNLKRIQGELKERLQALSEDLEIISNAENLETWRNLEFNLLQNIKEKISEIAFSYKPIYNYAVKRYKKKAGERTLFVYWIDIMVESPIREEKIFEPSFALRKLKSQISKKSFEILTKSVKDGLIPFHKEKAIPIEVFESALQNPRKSDELKSMAFYIEKPIVKLRPDIVKFRKEYDKLWKFLNINWDKMDKKCIQYGALTLRQLNIFDKTIYFNSDLI
ncbi:MAG: hypothetical protein WD717_03915 [Nitrosarchaeum sp.]